MKRSTMHAGCPYREVVHIKEGTGAKGGGFWTLTLSCGHIAVRHRRDAKKLPVRRILQPIQFAPRRVRCFTCGAVAVAFPEKNRS